MHGISRGLRSVAGVAVMALSLGGFAAVTAQAAPAPSTSASSSTGNPYSPAYQHPYRHGVLPTITQLQKMKSYDQSHPSAAAAATGSETLSYGGGIDNIGVQSGHSKVYLVF